MVCVCLIVHAIILYYCVCAIANLTVEISLLVMHYIYVVVVDSEFGG